MADNSLEESRNGSGDGKRKSMESESQGGRGTRVKRNRYVSIACNECKRRKIKCNGETPCQRCGNLSLECLYAPNCCTTSVQDSEEFQQMRAHMSSLQEQVDNLYFGLSSLRDQQDTYTAMEHQHNRAISIPAPNSRTLPPLRRPSQKSIPQFHGPTSSKYGFDVARSSLKTMGIDHENAIDEGTIIDETVQTPVPTDLVSSIRTHPSKDPIWGIDQAHAIRLARVYEEECGVMYPIVDIEHIVRHIKMLYTYVEAALRTGLTQAHLPGACAIEDEDTNLVKMVLATGLILEGNGESDTAQALYESIKPAITATITGPIDMKGISLLIVTATYCFHADEEGHAWRLIGMAARLCYEIGLHRKDSLLKSFTNEAEYLNAVRVFWIVYALDRRWSFGSGMPFALQDSDIDPLLPEPDDSNLYLKHITKYNKITSKVWSFNQSLDSSSETKRNETGFLDYQIQSWYQDVPESLKFNTDLVGENDIPSRGQRKLRFLLFLRANLARIQIYRPILHSATSIMENRQSAQKVIDVAKETISVIIRVNQTSDIYRTQQVVYNYFLIQALAVIFLATSHAPAEFFRQTRDEFYGALDLIKGFSTRSYHSKRLWTTIRGLRELGEKIGALARVGQHPALEAGQDAHSNAAVAMAGLAGHSMDDLAIYGAGPGRKNNNNNNNNNQAVTSLNDLGVSPMDGQQISNELVNLFELAGGYGNFDASPGPQGYNNGGYVGANGEVQAGGEGGANAFFGNGQEFSKIMGELF